MRSSEPCFTRRSFVTLAALAGALLATQTASATRYVFATFKGDTDPGEKLSIYVSEDALNFTLLSDTGFEGSSGTLRDPSIMRHRDGKYYVAYTNPPTNSCCGQADHFSIATSTDLTHWTDLTTVKAGVTGVKHTWAPEWFVEGNTVRIIANIDTLNNDSDFKPYVFTAMNDALTSWSGPVALGIGPNYIDAFVMKSGATYHAFVKNETTRYAEHATATAVTGPWTFVGSGNWAGWGSGREGPNVVRLDDGKFRIFMDGQNSVGFLQATSSDLSTWSSTTPLPGVSDLVRHGTIIRDEVPNGSAGGGATSGGAANGGTANGRAGGGGEANGGSVNGGTASGGAANGGFVGEVAGGSGNAGDPSQSASGSGGSVGVTGGGAASAGAAALAGSGAILSSDDAGGCSCRMAPQRSPRTGLYLGALLLFLARRRRAD